MLTVHIFIISISFLNGATWIETTQDKYAKAKQAKDEYDKLGPGLDAGLIIALNDAKEELDRIVGQG